MIAALFVDPKGCYVGLPDVDPWPESRDARLYAGPHPVVAHPPCQLWVNFAAVNWKRWGRQLPAWYPGGDDGGCFAAALASVRRWGGILEHPASSHAWGHHRLPRPIRGRWAESLLNPGEWVCEVAQSAYGHRARKLTWLFYVGPRPFDLDWRVVEGTHQIGRLDARKPTLAGRAASATPPAFRDALLSLAQKAVT